MAQAYSCAMIKGRRRRFVSVAPTGLSPRVLREEVVVVLALSLLASVVYSVIDLLSAPVAGVVRATYAPSPLAPQLADIAFGLAPVWLVLYLLRRDGGGAATLGLSEERPGRAALSGIVLAALVGALGAAVYLAAVEAGVNRFIVPVPPTGYWWTVPVLIAGAAQTALLEEVVVVGFLVTRLRQISWSPGAAVAGSALLRASYHLYQGWGGFAGNLGLGILFGCIFVRRGRLWPLVIAHFLLDAGAGVIYLLFGDRLPG